ncbi:DNA methyltransferase [Kocuria sp.]|uniref:DNA methyltransferase n=1 Tax=Kocuria sp. TaxID=1871328 RepID=UPI0026DF7609|nr:DNA methyltransferase [Kocuria sp.]MDO5617272.1 DNA methyltransferase [Kocuria sp.]
MIPQSRLDIEPGRRVNSLPWRGQFSPGLVEVLLQTYSEGGLVVDPFCGSGTTMIEAARAGLPSHGVEVNPAAQILASLYLLVNFHPSEREKALNRVFTRFAADRAASSDTGSLLRVVQESDEPLESLVANAVFLLALKNGDTVLRRNLDRALRLVSDLVESLPDAGPELSIQLGDSRSIFVPDGQAGMVLTSPPYVNVFNYHQNYRKAVELLGYGVLPAARAEFGSNRKHRQNRFLTIIQYAQDIGETLRESLRAVRNGGVSVWVVGRESSVRGSAVPNPQIVYEMATGSGGLELVGKHERKFRSRYGALVYEDILVFRHVARAIEGVNPTLLGREVGCAVLGGLIASSDETESEIAEAVSLADKVNPSALPDHGRVSGQRCLDR